ncbi:unnamed protein product, partial [Nesidiocoris tenuis]
MTPNDDDDQGELTRIQIASCGRFGIVQFYEVNQRMAIAKKKKIGSEVRRKFFPALQAQRSKSEENRQCASAAASVSRDTLRKVQPAAEEPPSNFRSQQKTRKR